MSLQVLVGGSSGLSAYKGAKINPFVQLDLRGTKKESDSKSDTTDPIWDETIEFELDGTKPLSENDILTVHLKSKESIGSTKSLGSGTVNLSNILNGKGAQKCQVQLQDANKTSTGTVYLTVTHKKDEENGGNLTSGEKRKLSHQLGKTRQFSNNPEKFQIRVKIIKARQLAGENLNPLCTVRYGDQVFQTKVQMETSSPFYDETFLFHVNKLPTQFFEDSVTFQAVNSKFLRAKALIGTAQLSVHSAYNEINHAFLRKWLALVNPDDEENSSVAGYLKVCIAVLASGDECPNFSTADEDDDDEDIESNVLWPDSGITLQPATFSLLLYKAEDLPRMDAGVMEDIRKFFGGAVESKELVDPYLVFSFCGRQVTSKVIYSNDHPMWNQILNLGFLFPSLCNSIKLTLFDWDRVSKDDVIATAHLNLSQISSAGEEGFLPTFGPTYVNFYGSSREFSAIQSNIDDEMNEGKVEGLSYRGRVLLALKTNLGDYPENAVTNLESDEELRISPFCRRRKYLLKAVFYTANLMSETNEPVEFEVSMGLSGDKNESTTLPSISTTQSMHAVYDGCMYFYMPWMKSKPCVMIPCQWEDISFRLEVLNILQKTMDNLDHGIELMEQFERAGISSGDQQFLLLGILEQLILDCSVEFPQPTPGYHAANELDKMLAHIRSRKLEKILQHTREVLENSSDIKAAVEELRTLRTLVQSITIEPQNSMPDVIISMIIAKKKIGYCRIPAHSILYSPNQQFSGCFCNKIQTLALKVPGNPKSEKIPALVRVKLWFGLDSHHSMFKLENEENTESVIFAETYENQVNILGSWKSRSPTMSRPSWSDASGQLNLPQDRFVAPVGWAFDGNWFINPETSKDTSELDTSINSFVEVLVENQTRSLAGTWYPATVQWTDLQNNPSVAHCELECPQGWQWVDCWQVDLNRAVDEEGWQYAIDSSFGGFSSAEKTFHMFRCRRWFCQRVLEDASLTNETGPQDKQLSLEDGWEYAPMFNLRFHSNREKLDVVRRRRWHRKLLPIAEGSLPLFRFTDSKGISDDPTSQSTYFSIPRLFLVFKNEFKYQLNVYLYQARDLIAGDKTGFSDPFASVCFHTRSQKSEIVKQTLCPQWDQTLLFEQISFYNPISSVGPYIPQIVVEIYDHDQIGAAEFLGRAFFDAKLNQTDLKLNWYPIIRGKKPGGEILAAAQLFQIGDEVIPPELPSHGYLYKIPEHIKPTLRRMAVEILCWGVRNLKSCQLLPVNHPSVTFEIGNTVIQSSTIKNVKENPNFDSPLFFLDVYLPEEKLYMPPVNIKVRDHRPFGRVPLVGVHVINSLKQYYCQPRSVDDENEEDSENDDSESWSDTILTINQEEEDSSINEEFDWWAKYYASIGDFDKCGEYLQMGFEPLQIFETELERVAPFQNFTDFLTTFHLHRGKSTTDDTKDSVGEFKGTMRVYPLPEDDSSLPPKILHHIPSSSVVEVLVRVYIIRAIDLTPKDSNGLADPYIVVKLGKNKQNSRNQFKPNTLNPLFGQMFEMKTRLPLQKDLVVQIYDKDLIGSDELIGQTEIDLENRFLTKHRATCGLPTQYFTGGPYRWRDGKTPKEILSNVCKMRNLPTPKYRRGGVYLGKNTYSIHDFEKRNKTRASNLGPTDQRLALHVLHTLDLVPEHVETRRLFNPVIPGMDQGKLEMWVDIFPLTDNSQGIPVNIEPRVAQRYELRCVIWNTKDVAFKDVNIAGEEMSDIYVKGWLEGVNQVQKTDIHYRSTDGEGNFNWRFVFPFEYIKAEKVVKVSKKEHFWELEPREYFHPPKLCIQIWDSDIFASDDFIGYLDLDLLNMSKPVRQSDLCSLEQVKKKNKKKKKWWKNPKLKKKTQKNPPDCIDLFEKKHVYGFWPCIDDSNEQPEITGKIEMEIELLTFEESEEKPAGKARDEPNCNPQLDPPKRPDIFLKMFFTPWKAFCHIWDKIKWHVLTVFLIFLLVVFILIALYTLPQAAVDRIVKSL